MLQAVIIDDEASNIENLTILLQRYCPEIELAGSAASVDEGVLLIKRLNPAIEFLDIQMPGKNGFDLLKVIGHPDFEVIFVTAFDQYAIQAIRFSAIHYLLKPVAIEELMIAVKKAVSCADKKRQNARLEKLLLLLENKENIKIAIPASKRMGIAC